MEIYKNEELKDITDLSDLQINFQLILDQKNQQLGDFSAEINWEIADVPDR